MVSPKYTDAFNQLKGYLADFEEKEKGKNNNFLRYCEEWENTLTY